MIRLIACGKIKEKWMREGIDEYAKRIQAYEKLEIIEVKDEKTLDSNSEAENNRVKKIEGDRLLKQVKDDDYVILLDLAGKPCDSISLSKKIDTIHTSGKSRIDFIIGGSLGLSEEVIHRADMRWMISVNTFPHQLCRMIVLEQIYRAFKILNHEPYHK